jgi:NTE family protein
MDASKADLVLEGGGVKGIALVGAISVLEERGMTFERVAGTSAGAIVGSLVAAGMTASELQALMEALDYRKFRDDTGLDHIPLVGKLASLWHEHGMYAGDYFHDWISGELANLNVKTFRDLYRPDPGSSLPSDQQYKLVVMTSDVSRGQLLRLPWDYPSYGIEEGAQAVAGAVRASMSIPFFFRPVNLKVPQSQPSVLVDGGMLSNFPIDAFDRTDGKAPRWPTIGIKLSSKQPPNVVQHQVNGDLSLVLAILGTLQSWSDKMQLDDPLVAKRTIFIDTFGVNATDFDLDLGTRQKLYENGRQAALTFLETWNPAA